MKAKNPRKVIGGMKAKAMGNGFEELFEATCNRCGVIVTPIPDGCRTYFNPRTRRNELTRVRSPFDYLITMNGLSATIDTKTVDADRISYSFIDEHQLESLLKTAASINSGYIVWFRKSDVVVFFSAFRLAKVQPGDGLTIDDGLVLGSIGSFELEPVLKWIDDGVNKKPMFQQRFL